LSGPGIDNCGSAGWREFWLGVIAVESRWGITRAGAGRTAVCRVGGV